MASRESTAGGTAAPVEVELGKPPRRKRRGIFAFLCSRPPPDLDD